VQHGYFPEWSSIPPLAVHPISGRKYSPMERQALSDEIQTLLASGAIRQLDLDTLCFISDLFLVPKKGGKVCPVIDLRQLNQYVQYQHFKMENLELVKSLVRRGDYMISIDLNQAFFHIPLERSQQPIFPSISKANVFASHVYHSD